MTEPRAAACRLRHHPPPPSLSRFSIRSTMFKKLVSRLRDTTVQPSSFFPVHRRAHGYANGAGNSRDGVRAGSRGGGEEEARAPGRSRGHGVVEATEGGAATSKAPRATWSMCHKRGRSGSATVSAPLAPRRSSLNVIVFAAIVTDPDKGWPVREEGDVYALFWDVFRWSGSLIRKISALLRSRIRVQILRRLDAVSFFYGISKIPTRKHTFDLRRASIRERFRNGMVRDATTAAGDRFEKTDVIRDRIALASYDSFALRACFKDSIVIRLRGRPGCAYLFVRFSRSAHRWIPSVELRAKAER